MPTKSKLANGDTLPISNPLQAPGLAGGGPGGGGKGGVDMAMTPYQLVCNRRAIDLITSQQSHRPYHRGQGATSLKL